MTTANTIRWHTARDASAEARRLPHVLGARSRFEPDLTPGPAGDPWPVSTHTIVRTEAWAGDTGDEAVKEIERELAALPGVVDHGHVPALESSKDGGRRPYAWVLRRQDTGSYCDHRRENWSS
jgi:hypothetical protein